MDDGDRDEDAREDATQRVTRDEARTPIRDTSSRSGNRRLMFNARPQVLPRVLPDARLPSILGNGNCCQLRQLLHSYVLFQERLTYQLWPSTIYRLNAVWDIIQLFHTVIPSDWNL